jgi:hypothetical protein
MSAEHAIPRDDEFILSARTANNKDTAPELSGSCCRILIPHDPDVARYNAAVIGSDPNDILILVREVPRATVRAGTPDKGSLILYRSTPDKVERAAQIDISHPEISNWEDARAFKSEEIDSEGIKRENVLLGLTAIRAKDNKPVAATIRGSIVNGTFSIDQKSLTVYLDSIGKNLTPISPTELLFRPEGFTDSLEVVETADNRNRQDTLRVTNEIKFPKTSWSKWQIGTQAQFLPGGILPIHGVNKFVLDTTPEGKDIFGYTYSLGLAEIVDGKVVKMTDKPIFTRESFKKILPMGQELDTNKDVIYCCGYSVDKNIVKFVINIGDLMTVEVSKTLAELQEALDNSSPIISEQMPEAIAA